MQLVTVKFGVDKRAGKSYESYYGGSRPNRNSTYNYLWDTRQDSFGNILPTKPIHAGDHVVVHTPSHGLTVAEVVRVEPFTGSTDAYKWIVDTVNWEAYERAERARRETRGVERRLRMERRMERQRLQDAIETREATLRRRMAEIQEKLLLERTFELDPNLRVLAEDIDQMKAELEALN